jgi:hypothetical protein
MALATWPDLVKPTARQAVADGHDTACRTLLPLVPTGLVVVWIVHRGGAADASGAVAVVAAVAAIARAAATASFLILSSSFSRRPAWPCAAGGTDGLTQ